MAKDYGYELAKIALDVGAIKLRPNDPFTWASGYRMPIYNDNRLLLGSASHRALVAEGFEYLIGARGIRVDVIAGTATAGIPPATTLADRLKLPLVYIRDKPKEHGMRNQIEGIDGDKSLEGRSALVVEDLISTGGSSFKAVEAARAADGQVSHLFSIFNYGLAEAAKLFSDGNCEVHSLLWYPALLEVAKVEGRIIPADMAVLEEWRLDPFNWGEKRGFPKKQK